MLRRCWETPGRPRRTRCDPGAILVAFAADSPGRLGRRRPRAPKKARLNAIQSRSAPIGTPKQCPFVL